MGVKQEMVFLGRDLGEQRNYSEEIAALIDEEVRGLVSDGYETAKRILTERRGHLELISEHLKNVETIDAAEFDRLLAQEPPAAAAASRSTAS